VRERDMPLPHWYLLLVGIEPKNQGHGLGTELLRPMLNRLNRLGSACYLETEEARNIRFYLKNGFEMIVNGQMPYWCAVLDLSDDARTEGR
jgi:GNAT superfamily N-acetyltransferase